MRIIRNLSWAFCLATLSTLAFAATPVAPAPAKEAAPVAAPAAAQSAPAAEALDIIPPRLNNSTRS